MRLTPRASNRRGVVLLAVLFVVVTLTLAAYQYSDWMMAEYRAADSFVRSTQARALADSGVHYTAALLANRESFEQTLGGNPFDNPGAFQGVSVPSPSGRPGLFTVLSPCGPDDPQAQSQPY